MMSGMISNFTPTLDADMEMASTAHIVGLLQDQLTNHSRQVLTSRIHRKMFPSLKSLAAKCIWENRFLFDHPEDINLFALIPNSLKSFLLARFFRFYHIGMKLKDVQIEQRVEFINSFWKILLLLLDNDVVTFKFPYYPCLMNHLNADLSLWGKLLQKCPKLTNIFLEESAIQYYHGRQHLFLNSLMSMKQLQILELNPMWFNDSNLCSVAEQLPNLSVLQVCLEEEVSERGIKALSKLQHLQEFIFVFRGCICNYCLVPCISAPGQRFVVLVRIMHLCMLHLSNLRVVGQRFPIDCTYGHKQETLAMLTEEVLPRLKKPCTLGLKEIATTVGPFDGIQLPNLTSLMLCTIESYPTIGFQCDSWLAKVTELGLYDIPKPICLQIFTKIGHQLKIVRLIISQNSMAVDNLLRMCPNLEQLFLSGFSASYIELASQVQPDTLHNLKSLSFQFLTMSINPIVTPKVLPQLLQAPELRKLVLCCCLPATEEIMQIKNMLEQHQILQKLESATIKRVKDSIDRFQLLSNLLTLHCPNLTEVSDLSTATVCDYFWNSDKPVTGFHTGYQSYADKCT